MYISLPRTVFYHNDFRMAAEKLEEAIKICEQYPDILPYIDKRAELMNCLLDVYRELQDLKKCCKLIVEIDQINEKNKEQGIYRKITPEIREKAGL